MKSKFLLLIISLSLNMTVFGQICGTSSNETFKTSQKTVTDSKLLNTLNSICVNVYFHIVRESNGSGGFSSNQLDNVTNILNSAFNAHNLYLNNTLGFDYINNSTYYNIDDTGNSTNEFDALVQINNIPNAINIYIVNNAVSYAGRANGILSQALVIEKNYVNTQVVSHEVGHCLDLLHTFQGTATNSSGCAEAINGSNCTSCGDKVCDTPADANTGNSGGYTPDMDNIMSYYYPFNHFSNGQASRIRQAFASSSLLQQVISNSCEIPEINGSLTICTDDTNTYSLTNIDQNDIISWQVSSNLQIISSTNNSVTVKPINNSAIGNATIYANINNTYTLSKDIIIGTPITVDDIDGALGMDGEYEILVETNDGNGNDFEWKVNGVLVNDNGNDWVRIYFGDYPCINNQIIISMRKEGVCGWSSWVSMNYTECEDEEAFFRFSSNPMNEGGSVNEIIITDESILGKKNYEISILNKYGIKIYSKKKKEKNVYINFLKKGFYFVNYQNTEGISITKKLIIK